MKKWAIVYNPNKQGTQEVAQQMADILQTMGAQAELLPGPVSKLEGFEIAASVGGDGTLLGMVSAALAANIPVVGVNMGKLGYLACLRTEDLPDQLRRIMAGEFRNLERCTLEVEFPNGHKEYALNDLVIKSAEFRLAELSVEVDGEWITQYDCDGLIVATATGSTAYNLSAGGPILHQGAQSIVLTPICAHSLTNRSLLFDHSSTLTIENASPTSKVQVSVDGRAYPDCSGCIPIKVRAACKSLTTFEDPQRGAFATLRQKLSWK